MMRRRFLRGLLAGSALVVAAVGGLAPAMDTLGVAAARSLRAPADLLVRVRRRTRSLHEDDLYQPHDLAG